MKTVTKKILYAVPIVVLVVLCACLIRMLPHGDEGEDIAVMGTGAETTTIEPETTAAPETTAPIDLSSKGLLFESLGNGTCLVSGAGSCRDSLIVLPARSPEGDTVVGIAAYAFRNCTFLKGIELPSTVRTIGAYAFYGSGIGGIDIPDGVYSIGEYAFCGCYSLTAIKVSPENITYSDDGGVLMNKSQDTIICYPAGKGDNFYAIPAGVREIRTMAFYNCSAIKLIHFAGSGSAFHNILIGAGNEVIESAVITYSASSDIFSDGNGSVETIEK